MYLAINRLLAATKDHYDFSDLFLKNPSGIVKTYFNPLFNSFGKRLDPKQYTNKVEVKKNLLEEWSFFTSQVSPSDPQVKRIIRLGLFSNGLEYNKTFQELITKQRPQSTLYKWLYAYVIRFQILNPNFDHSETLWLDLLLKWTIELKQNPNLRINISSSEAVIKQFKDRVNDDKKYSEYIDDKVQLILDGLYGDQLAMMDISLRLLSLLNQEFHINFYSSDYFYQTCLASMFDKSQSDYLANRDNIKKLNDMLSTFCLFNHEHSRDRFIVLFTNLFNRITSSEKELIKNFLKSQLGDPRLSKQTWGEFKDKNNAIYKEILFWFNEADFELFFEYVFAGQPDEHGRQECWKKYLPYADDIRIFLPRSRIADFKNLAKQNNRESILEPIENISMQTSFIIKIGKIIVFETVETKNASYIYDLAAPDFESPKKYSSQKDVLTFYNFIFNSSNYQQQPMNTKAYLAFTDLAPNGSDKYSFSNNRHWRFTHDKNYRWHDSVRNMMQQVHDLSPYKKNLK